MTAAYVDIWLSMPLKDMLPQACLAIAALFLCLYLARQIHVGRLLHSELDLLQKTHKHNVEYEFVVDTMKLSIWHMNPRTGELTFEHDYREVQNLPNVAGALLSENVVLLDPRDAPRVEKALQDLCTGKQSTYHEIYRVKVTYNNTFYWEESYATIAERNADGEPTKIVGTTMRVDDRKNMEEALMQARNRAEESDRLKSAFIANMSHEIRTPLNAIVGFTSVIPDITDAAERQTLLDLIHENTQNLLRIVDDVVNISKIESGKEQLIMSTFDLNAQLLNQVVVHQSKLKPGVEMTAVCPESQLMVTSDSVRLDEILRHLLSNAIKFTSQGYIRVGYNEPVDGRVTIWVSDTGKGIAPENHERVFERFFKVDEFVPGAGLGLSLCRVMAYSLGGDVTVESELGKGSVFKLQLPLGK